ncbi:E3 ubiquitin-protein ligase BRE1B-like [Agelaius phoeniceus]|uniref:E3 ubiquitin-protein ligase BRE1B-like n=1 Tax=Agelaius phoeniceus TaxID=39638 RepID=UPI004054EAC5
MAGVGTKRGPPEAGGGPPREATAPGRSSPRPHLIEPLRLGGISSTEEMDVKVLQFRNKKLAERLEQRQACEDELRERIEKLEKRQATDDATLHLVNRFWAQLDSEVQAPSSSLRRRRRGWGRATGVLGQFLQPPVLPEQLPQQLPARFGQIR